VLRRRRREGADLPERGDGAQDAADMAEIADDRAGSDRFEPSRRDLSGGRPDQGSDSGGELLAGPWDIAAEYPAAERIDCGSLLIPVLEGFDVQINVAEEQGVWVAVVHGDSGMQLQAFAASRGGGLWDEIRQEIAENIAESGGSCQEEYGALGTELHARVPLAEAGQPGQELQSVRFLGHDGPRWFLRGVISGPAAADRDEGAPFEALFADVVVVRGDHPAPPREQLEIRLPEEAREALESQLAEDEGWELPNPFERGPEITEIR
jgi:uncharacterized protein DUF3710